MFSKTKPQQIYQQLAESYQFLMDALDFHGDVCEHIVSGNGFLTGKLGCCEAKEKDSETTP